MTQSQANPATRHDATLVEWHTAYGTLDNYIESRDANTATLATITKRCYESDKAARAAVLERAQDIANGAGAGSISDALEALARAQAHRQFAHKAVFYLAVVHRGENLKRLQPVLRPPEGDGRTALVIAFALAMYDAYRDNTEVFYGTDVDQALQGQYDDARRDIARFGQFADRATIGNDFALDLIRVGREAYKLLDE